MRKNTVVLMSITIISLIFIFYQSADAKFINTWIQRWGGGPMSSGDETILAKFDIIAVQRFHYDDIGGNTWRAIREINPNIKIYLYLQTVTLGPLEDSFKTLGLSSFGRYSVSRGHSMGSVNGDNPKFFLLDSTNKRIQWTWPDQTRYWLDFGDSDFQNYSIEALLTDYIAVTGSVTEDPPNDLTGVLKNSNTKYRENDHNGKTITFTSGMATNKTYTINGTTSTTIICTGYNLYGDGVRSGDTYSIAQPWIADGVFNDYVWAVQSDTTATPVKYDTIAKWTTSMNGFINNMMVAVSATGQKYACNRGLTRYSGGVPAWTALDSSAHPPDIVLDESFFAVKDGAGVIQQFNETNGWKTQVDLLASIHNSKVFCQSSTELNPGETGKDYYGKSCTFWDGLWYALSSYLLGKNETDNNSYFFYTYGSTSDVNKYYDEYDNIDLGKAATTYKITNYAGNNIYWREFQKGYVYVNPTLNDVTSITLPEICKQRTHDNLKKDLRTLQNIDTIDLKSHRAAILYKSNHLALLNTPNNLRVIVK